MRSIISKILTVLIVFAFLQIPFFMMQYRHYLEGHFKELEIYREELMKSASKSNLSLESYVLHFENNPDPIVGSQGHVMTTTLERFEDFGKARLAFQEATPWSRPLIFVRYLDRGVVSETLSHFDVGVNITLESLCYMILGFLISLLVSNPFKKRTKNGHV